MTAWWDDRQVVLNEPAAPETLERLRGLVITDDTVITEEETAPPGSCDCDQCDREVCAGDCDPCSYSSCQQCRQVALRQREACKRGNTYHTVYTCCGYCPDCEIHTRSGDGYQEEKCDMDMCHECDHECGDEYDPYD